MFDPTADRRDLAIKLIESALFCLADLQITRVAPHAPAGSSMSKWKSLYAIKARDYVHNFRFS